MGEDHPRVVDEDEGRREGGRSPARSALEPEVGEESEIPLGMKWIGCRMDGHSLEVQREVVSGGGWAIDGKCPWA